MSDQFTTEIIALARWARDRNGGHPKEAWSTGEKLAVALVLNDQAFLDDAGYTEQEVAQRLSGDLFTSDIAGWLLAVRAALAEDRNGVS